MANVFTVIGVLIIIGGMIFVNVVLSEAPNYIQNSFGVLYVFGGLLITIFGITLDIMNSTLRNIQNRLTEIQKDINSPFGKTDGG